MDEVGALTSETELIDQAHRLGISPFVGVFSKDDMPPSPRNGGYIINLQDETDSGGNVNPGTHWVGLWIQNKNAIYFDPFGLILPADIELFLDGKDIWFNDMQVQDMGTGFCGWYTLSFLKYMHQYKFLNPEERLDRFLLLWKHDTTKNLSRLKTLMSLKK